MQKTTFTIQKMDCPSEEQLIRLKLGDFINIASLQFDIPSRRLDIYHTGDYRPFLDVMNHLHLDVALVESSAADEYLTAGKHDDQRRLLLQVLAINFFFFLLEMVSGFISGSMGLIGDSLDMLADSLVYGLALFAVGGTTAKKERVAKASGYFQFLLAVFGIVEVIRRFLGFNDIPTYQTMIIVSTLALIGNTASLLLLQKSKSTEAHMRASIIFTSNDVIINLGVIVAGVLVFASKTRIPDLVVGMIIFCIVARGAWRILQLAK